MTSLAPAVDGVPPEPDNEGGAKIREKSRLPPLVGFHLCGRGFVGGLVGPFDPGI